MKSASVCYTLATVTALLLGAGCAATRGNSQSDAGGGGSDGGGGSSESAARVVFAGSDNGAVANTNTGVGSAGGGGSAGSGDAGSGGSGGDGGSGDKPCNAPVFAGIVRDFKAFAGGAGHPDMEVFTGEGLKGLVQSKLGPDHKPVYAPDGPTAMTTGKEAFDQWFRDVDGVNIAMPLELVPTVDADGIATYQNPEFFPIDGQGFGDEWLWHNFHFTFELHMQFIYHGGEMFEFGGDDDVFVFVNDVLAIDLGGVHMAQTATLDLDERAAELGIEPGEVFGLDLFMAERHTTESKFRITSSLAFTNCKPIVY